MRGTALGAATYGWALMAALATASGVEADGCARTISTSVVLGETISLVAASEMPPGLLIAAIGYWESCAGYGETFPRLVEGSSGTSVVNVRFVRGKSVGRHCGTFHGRTITLYASATAANSKPISCGSLEQNLAHEIGHVLGLDDVESPSCRRRIMSMIDPDTARSRRVHPEECALVGRKWLTLLEAGHEAFSGSQAGHQMTELVFDVGREHRLGDLLP